MLAVAQPFVAQMLAQSGAAADATRMINLVIILLVGIAIVLALLTGWYWRHTDPRRRAARARAAMGRRARAVSDEADGAQTPGGQAPGGPAAPATTASAPPAAADPDDDWLSLTAPQSSTTAKETA